MNFGQPPPNTTAAPTSGFTFGAPAPTSGFTFGAPAADAKPPAQVSFGGFGEAAKAPTLFGNMAPTAVSAAASSIMPRAGGGDSTFTMGTPSQQPSFGAFQPLPPATATSAAATTAGISFGSPSLNTTSTFGIQASQPTASLGTTPFGGQQSFSQNNTITSQSAPPAASASLVPSLATSASQPIVQTANSSASLSLTSNTQPGVFSFAAPVSSAPTTNFTPMLGGKTLGSPSTNTSLLGKTAAPATSTSFAPIALSTETKTTQSSSVKQSQQINFCKLEELVNKWNQALEEQEKLFTNQATQLNAWDQLLIENGEKLVSLNEAVEKVKAEQTAVEQELEFISAQHIELEECILPLQKELAKTPQIDVERSQIYSIAENLDTQLKQMTEDLKAVIEQLNEANKAQDPNDPIVQIGRILNAHLNSMQWIETSTSLIGSKLDDITKVHEIIKRDNEKTMRRYFH